MRRAHAYATKAHAGQSRLSGEPYITHPVAVATIIADLGLDTVERGGGAASRRRRGHRRHPRPDR